MEQLLIILIVIILIGTILIPIAIGLAKRFNIVDRPDEKRKFHNNVTPYLGGVIVIGAFYSGISIGAVLMGLPVPILPLIGLSLLFITGLVDDIYDMKAVVKLLFQIVAILFIIPLNRFNVTTESLLIFFTILGLGILVINAFNLIDGMDGLASGQVLILLPLFLVASVLQEQWALVLNIIFFASAVAVFSFANLHPAKIFLGDAGSLFQGGVLFWIVSSLAFPVGNTLMRLYPFLILFFSLPVIDVFSVIIQRLIAHHGIMSADRRHIHHQVLKLCKSSATVVSVLNGVLSLYTMLWIVGLLRTNTLMPLLYVIPLWALFYGVVFFKIKSLSHESKTRSL